MGKPQVLTEERGGPVFDLEFCLEVWVSEEFKRKRKALVSGLTSRRELLGEPL